MRYVAERRNLDESIEELRQIADGRNDILAEAAGITAGPRGDRNSGRHLALAPRGDLVRVVGVASAVLLGPAGEPIQGSVCLLWQQLPRESPPDLRQDLICEVL